MAAPNIETIVSISKRRGFVFPSSEIYGGLGSAWDYGPLGVELSNNVKQAWWRWMVHERDDMEGIDSSIILNRSVWKYSGHEETFSDPLVDCLNCKNRFRADKLIETLGPGHPLFEAMPNYVLTKTRIVKCPNCGESEWTDYCIDWLKRLGIGSDNLRFYAQPKEELAHYAKRTVDIHYRFFPEREDEERQWDELMGIANRTDFDLKAHWKKPEDAEGKRLNPDSTEDLSYFDEATKERYYPYVIEPASGVNRTVLAVLMDAYGERTNDKGEKRVILKLHPTLAPIKVAVLPLAKNKPEIVGMAKALKRSLQPVLRAVYDDTGGIGKLYARQDEIGTPFCITVDHQSLEDEAVTVRDRDTWEQERVKVADLATHLLQRLAANAGQ